MRGIFGTVSAFPVEANNILVIQLRQIGDVLLTTPAVKVLRDYYPQSRISYLTETVPARLLHGNPHIDRIITRNRQDGLKQSVKLVQKLRQAKFDLVIDFFCNPRSAWLSFLTGAPHRIAAHHAWRSWWYTYTPKIEGGTGYAAEHNLALLRAIGVGGELVPLTIHVTEDAEHYIDEFLRRESFKPFDRIVTIDLTSRRQAKRWIPARYVQLADRLVEKHAARIIFVWGPGEKEMVASLIKHSKHKHTLACPTDLMQLTALIAKSDLHIGNCSAPRHIAVAVGTSSLTVMGPTIPGNWTYPAPIHQVVRGNVSCLECHKTECKTLDCMKALTVQEVERVVEQLLTRDA